MNTLLNKKTPYALMLALVGLTFWFGCKSDDDKQDGPACNLSGSFTYDSNIKGIIDRHCISCHAPGSGVSGADIYDFRAYDGMKPHLDAGHFRDRVVIDKDMPENNSTGMTQAERDSINCWILAGYPKN